MLPGLLVAAFQNVSSGAEAAVDAYVHCQGDWTVALNSVQQNSPCMGLPAVQKRVAALGVPLFLAVELGEVSPLKHVARAVHLGYSLPASAAC